MHWEVAGKVQFLFVEFHDQRLVQRNTVKSNLPESFASRLMLAILRPCWNNGPVAAGGPGIERVEKGVGSLFNRHVPDVCEPVAFPIKPAPLAVFIREVDEVGSVVSLSRSVRKSCQRRGNGH